MKKLLITGGGLFNIGLKSSLVWDKSTGPMPIVFPVCGDGGQDNILGHLTSMTQQQICLQKLKEGKVCQKNRQGRLNNIIPNFLL